MVKPLSIETHEQRTLIAVPAVFLLVATTTVVMRLYVRSQKRQRYFVHDYLCVAALVLTYCCYIDLILCVVYGGLGKPITTLSLDNIDFVFKSLLGISILWGTTVSVVQLSILALYVQVFGVVKWHRWTCYSAMAVVGGWWASWFVTSLTSCIPLSKFWTPQLPGKCINEKQFCLGSGFSHLVVDIFILTFSLPIIWRLKTSIQNKLAISIACSLGLFATLSGLLRMDCLISLIPYDEENFTQSAWLGVLFELLENSCGVICSCMPMFPFLLQRLSSSGFGGSIRGFLSNIRTTMSIRRLLSTVRSSPDNTLAIRSTGTNRSKASDLNWPSPQKDNRSSGTFGNSSYRALVEPNDARSTDSGSNIPLENVTITRTWNVAD